MPPYLTKVRLTVFILAAIVAAAGLWLYLRPAPVDLTRVYRIGYGNDSPMHFLGADGRPQGLASDLVQRAARARGVRLEWIRGQDFDPQTMDLWVLYTIWPERLGRIHFSEPYLQVANCFIVRADSPYHMLSDLTGTRISVNHLGVVENALTQLLPGAKMVPTVGNVAAIAALGDGQVEAAFVDDYNIVSFALHGQAHPPYRILPIRSPKRYMAIASTFAAAAVADELRAAMQGLADAGQLDDVINRWTFFANPITDTLGDQAAARRRARWMLLGITALSAIAALAVALAVATRWQTSRLRRAEQFLKEIADSVPGIVFQHRRNADGTSSFPYMSEALHRIYGLGPAAVRLDATPFFAASHPDDREVLRSALEASARSLQPCVLEFRVGPGGGGPVRWLTFNAVPHREPGGVTVWHGVILEVTEAKQAEVALKQIERRLHEAQKLESLGMLAGRIAHDFNNLLTGMLGNVSLASADLPPDSPLVAFLDAMRQGCLRAAGLCKQLLAYSGTSRFVVRKVSLNALVEESQQLLQVSINRRCELRLHLTLGLPPVEADETQIHQVIVNLVINAADAVDAGTGLVTVGTSLVRLSATAPGGSASPADLPPGPYVCLEVKDNGCGMSEATRARIFEPFFTTKPTGHGLGLAAVQGIVRSHRGRLTVDSVLGRGTTFRLLFPAASGAADPLTPAGAAPSDWQGRGCILLVDDDELVLRATAKLLEKVGLKVVTAVDGQEAVDLFRARPEHFTLVLMDLTMPRLDGRQAFQQMRAVRENVRVVLMSGFEEDPAPHAPDVLRPAGFLQKPFSFEALREMLRQVSLA